MIENVKRFRIALSFPGEERSYVEEVAGHLGEHFGKEQVFYDANYSSELARVNLDTYLQKIYYRESDLVALFFNDSYREKMWCGLEWRAIRSLIADRSDHIILIKMSGSSLLPEGLFSIDGYLPADRLKPVEIATNIITRHALDFCGSASSSTSDALVI